MGCEGGCLEGLIGVSLDVSINRLVGWVDKEGIQCMLL